MDAMISFIFFLLLGTVAGVILSRLFNKWNAR